MDDMNSWNCARGNGQRNSVSWPAERAAILDTSIVVIDRNYSFVSAKSGPTGCHLVGDTRQDSIEISIYPRGCRRRESGD